MPIHLASLMLNLSFAGHTDAFRAKCLVKIPRNTIEPTCQAKKPEKSLNIRNILNIIGTVWEKHWKINPPFGNGHHTTYNICKDDAPKGDAHVPCGPRDGSTLVTS